MNTPTNRLHTASLRLLLVTTCVFVSLCLVSLISPASAAPEGPGSGLVAWWRFDETSGTSASDSSGNSNTVTLTNGPTWVTGQMNNALNFDGSNDYARTPNSVSLNMSGVNLSISLWVKPQALSGGDSVLIGKAWTENQMSSPYYQYGVELQGGNTPILYFGNGTTVHTASAGTSLSYNTWTHIVVTYDGSNIRWYKDGASTTTIPNTASLQARSTSLTLGADCATNQPHKGALDDLRIYNRALSAAEVSELYNAAFPPDTQAPSVPTNLQASSIYSTQLALTWNASTDDRGVVGYTVFRNGTQRAQTTSPYYTDLNLTPQTSYTYTIAAYDAVPNTSAQSAPLSTATNNTPVPQDVIHPDRRIDWSQAGVEGGIPVRTTVCATLNPGATAAQINTAIQNCPAGQVVYLNEGVYTIGDPGIEFITKSNVTLRGAGADKTILLADDMGSVVTIGQQWAADLPINITSGCTKGSSQLVLANAGSINVNSYVRVDELNDPDIPVTNVGYGTCTWCGRDNGARVRGQIVKVTAKNGNTITISPPMYFTFKGANLPQVQAVGGPLASGMSAEYVGIEDLTIKNNWRPSKVKGTDNKEYSAMRDHTSSNDDRPVAGADWDYFWAETATDGSASPAWQANQQYNGDYNSERIPLQAHLTANCWTKNIKIENCGSRCVQLFYDNFRFEIRDSLISKCINRWDSNNCYGTLIGMYNSGILIENTIYESVADGPMMAWGASGNVMGYNYMYDAHRLSNMHTWFTANGASHHGAHTAFNLWEGNVLEAAYFDQYWGSHSHNTMYRNRIIGKYMVDGIADEQWMQSIQTLSTERNVHYQNYLGNVLGTDGYHDLYERNCAGCPNSFYDRMIYRTGYASSGNCETSDDDPESFNTMLRHMNYDYVTHSVKHCGEPGEPGCQGSGGLTVIPVSLYRAGKPTWFGNVPWPPIGPDVSGGQDPAGHANKIPAQLCYESTVGQGLPFNPAACYAVVPVAPTLGIGTASGAADTDVDIPVTFTSGDTAVASLQFDLILPASLSSVSVTDGPAAIAADKMSMSNVIGNALRVLVFGFNATPIDSGVIVTVRLHIAPGTASGTLALSMVGVVFSDPLGTEVPHGTPTDGSVTVIASPSVQYGDVSGNGTVSAYDASLTAQYAAGLITLTPEQITKAEVSGNGTVSAYDASLIAQKAAGLIDKFPIEP